MQDIVSKIDADFHYERVFNIRRFRIPLSDNDIDHNQDQLEKRVRTILDRIGKAKFDIQGFLENA